MRRLEFLPASEVFRKGCGKSCFVVVEGSAAGVRAGRRRLGREGGADEDKYESERSTEGENEWYRHHRRVVFRPGSNN